MRVYKGHYVATTGQKWHWKLLAGNNRLIACSGEPFYSKHDAVDAAVRMLKWGRRNRTKGRDWFTTRLIVDGKLRSKWA
jgi:uncharacterized protein YegP (UPF0339 family)